MIDSKQQPFARGRFSILQKILKKTRKNLMLFEEKVKNYNLIYSKTL